MIRTLAESRFQRACDHCGLLGPDDDYGDLPAGWSREWGLAFGYGGYRFACDLCPNCDAVIRAWWRSGYAVAEPGGAS